MVVGSSLAATVLYPAIAPLILGYILPYFRMAHLTIASAVIGSAPPTAAVALGSRISVVASGLVAGVGHRVGTPLATLATRVLATAARGTRVAAASTLNGRTVAGGASLGLAWRLVGFIKGGVVKGAAAAAQALEVGDRTVLIFRFAGRQFRIPLSFLG